MKQEKINEGKNCISFHWYSIEKTTDEVWYVTSTATLLKTQVVPKGFTEMAEALPKLFASEEIFFKKGS